MFTHLASRFSRLLIAVLILSVAVFALPRPVSAANPTIDIIGVKANESVTIRTHDFPTNVLFTVRMDVAGNLGIDGIVVAEINSGNGGSFDATFRIPAELSGKATIAIRLESSRGYFAYDWFNNRSMGDVPQPIPATGGSKPYLTVTGVVKNESATVEVFNLPENTNFTVRVGPYYTFFRDYVIVRTVNSGSTGAIKFTISLPDVVKNVELVTIRLDGGGRYAFNAFKNVDGGIVSPIPVTGGTCQIISATPGSAMPKLADFDATWTIKNTSNTTWDLNSVDYKFAGGSKLHKYNDRYDLPQTVKPGETVKIIVDMLAPNTAGFYTTTWALVQGSSTLCNFSLNLRVK